MPDITAGPKRENQYGMDDPYRKIEPMPEYAGPGDFAYAGRYYTWEQARRDWMKNEGDKQYATKRDEAARSASVEALREQRDQLAQQNQRQDRAEGAARLERQQTAELAPLRALDALKATRAAGF